MSCSNLLPNSLFEISKPAFQRKHLIEFLRRLGSIVCLILLDSMAMAGAVFLAIVLLDDLHRWNELLSLLPIEIFFSIVVMSGFHLYDRLPYRQSYILAVLGFSIPWLGAFLISHYYHILKDVDSLLLLGWLISLFLGVTGRRLYDTFTNNWHIYRTAGAATLFVGDMTAAADLESTFPKLLPNLRIVGRISPTTKRRDSSAIGEIADLPILFDRYQVRCLILAASALTSGLCQTIVQYCDYADIQLLVLYPLSTRKRLGIFSNRVGNTSVLEVRQSWDYTTQFIGKRIVDFLGAGLGLLFLSPVLLIIALAIHLDSVGPVFFRQQRLGRSGKPFLVCKFRTMEVNAEQRLKDLEQLNESQGGVLFKLKADPRVTRIGKFLRRTSLDELPQLFNVLQGQMSLVGPRPLQLRDCKLAIESNREAFIKRLTSMPGMTGLWQVSGRSEVAFDDMLRLDLYYIDRWSLLLDLQIIWRTIRVLLTARGAY